MSNKQLYTPGEDTYFSHPYIDIEELRETPVRHYFVHGGFQGTEVNGNQVKFCFYFPEKEHYEGRFFQYLSPAPEDEHESEHLTGEDDKISFALTHGAYYVVSNQGGFVFPMGERLYKASANSAAFSRQVAQKVYGYEHRPYGYVFGGSGGSFKTISCAEMTKDVWDGAVPYVIANPMATPNVFCPRMRVMRVLGEDGLKKLVERMDVGGSGDLYEGLDEKQRLVLEEATKMGFPIRGWFSWPYMGDGALMTLTPYVYSIAPEYFRDFWSKPGYEGTNPESTEVRDRLQFVTTVQKLVPRIVEKSEEEFTSVDNSWLNTMIGNQDTPHVLLSEQPPADAYLYHCRLRVMSGDAKGRECPVESIDDGMVIIGSAFDGTNSGNALEGLKSGDQIMIDNSDYLAMQTLQRHQVPDESYKVYDQYRDSEGNPKYPQLPALIGPEIAKSGGGSVPDGDIQCRVIAVCSLLDESALPWHGDWYRNAVKKAKGGNEEDWFRLYYNDNCIHDDRANELAEVQRQVDYLGVLHQALLDMAKWCEKGIKPVPATNYVFHDGQIEIPKTAAERGGLQPVADAYANARKCIEVKAGEQVTFTAAIEAPPSAGYVTEAVWTFEKVDEKNASLELSKEDGGRKAAVRTVHIFEKPGIYFPTLKVKSSRTGGLDDIFVQCKNLDRVKVIVK